jgi:hypothetical protein
VLVRRKITVSVSVNWECTTCWLTGGLSVSQGQRTQLHFPDLRVECWIDGALVQSVQLQEDELVSPGGKTHVFNGLYVSETERRLFRFAPPVSGPFGILRSG